MKVGVIKEDKEAKLTYPYLGEDVDGFIILFSAPYTGVVLKTDSFYEVGHYCMNWNEEKFTPIEGKVILQND